MPAMCEVAATPPVPCTALSGFACSQAMSSLRSFAASAFLTTISSGPLPTGAIGWKSSSTSNGSLKIALLKTCVGVLPWPMV
jgi:hypothetical protein